MNRSRSFAVLFDKLSRIERQSRPKYKSAVPELIHMSNTTCPNLIIKVRRLNRPFPQGQNTGSPQNACLGGYWSRGFAKGGLDCLFTCHVNYITRTAFTCS